MEETGFTKVTLLSILAVVIIAVLIGGGWYFNRGEGGSTATSTIAISEEINNQTSPTNNNQQKNMIATVFDKNKNYSAILHTTEGDITIEFTAQATPNTVKNFVTLAQKDFYNGTIFHRVIKGFMIQGGDPTGTGMGGPGYTFADEPFTGDYTRGTVAMANAGPNTNGSQFFIMHADGPLPKNYVIFGKVTKGLDVVDKIATAPVKASQSGENSIPVSPVKVTSVEVIEK